MTKTLEIFSVVIATIKFVDSLTVVPSVTINGLSTLVQEIQNQLINEFSEYGMSIAAESRLYESILIDLMKVSGKKTRVKKQPKKIKLSRRQLQELLRRQFK